MAAPKRPTHIVEHPRLFLAVDGKLKHFPKGKQLTLTANQAKNLGKRVKSMKEGETTDLTQEKKPAEKTEE